MIRYKSNLKKILAVALIGYVAVCAFIYFCPQFFFYNPNTKPSDIEKARKDGFAAVHLNYVSEDNTPLYGWYAKPKAKEKNGKIIIFMHGNSYHLETFHQKVLPFFKEGYAVFMPEYRGFGGIEGTLSQKNLSADALAAVKFVNNLGYKNQDIIVYGFSLGTYMATNSVYRLQEKEPFSALILEAPFDNIVNVAKHSVPFILPHNLVVRDKYDTFSIINKIKTRLLVMTGTKDKTVPHQLSKNLYNQAANPKELIIYEGGAHSNLYDFNNPKDILNWLKKTDEKA